MKTALPERAEYYRPTRARELREKAERLGKWHHTCWCMCRLMLLQFGSIALALYVLELLGFRHAFGLGSVIAGTLGAGIPLWLSLRRSAQRLRQEADALEAEHAVRYGSLPSGEEPPGSLMAG